MIDTQFTTIYIYIYLDYLDKMLVYFCLSFSIFSHLNDSYWLPYCFVVTKSWRTRRLLSEIFSQAQCANIVTPMDVVRGKLVGTPKRRSHEQLLPAISDGVGIAMP